MADESAEVAREILDERRRQMRTEGWSPRHDDQHDLGELALAAGCYALHAGEVRDFKRAAYPFDPPTYVPRHWPWDADWWKPKAPRRDLIRAGALIVAEIERLDRVASREADADPDHVGAFAASDAYRLRAAKAEAALVALIARLDAGGTPADVLADLATLLDETREIVPRAGEPPC